MVERKRAPNAVLRRIRQDERQESRAEFAEALAARAREMKENISPSERYIARLEDGDVKYPSAPYRRVLTALCGRPISELGFARRYADDQAKSAPALSGTTIEIPRQGRLMHPGNGMGMSSASALSPGDLALASEWPIWFGTRLAHLITTVDNWRDTTSMYAPLQELLHQEVLMFDAVGPAGQSVDVSHALSRRQALATLAALPISIGNPIGRSASERDIESFLARCAASLTACWHLLRGADLKTVDKVISAYIVSLEGVAGQQSAQQASAARLASQAHRISGILSLHHGELRAREIHCKQALFYASIADDPGSRASALVSLASTYFYFDVPARAAAVYERALQLGAEIPPLQRSRVHAELAVVYGQLGRDQDAMRSIGRAQELYPEYPEQDRSFLYAEFSPASLILEHGLAYVALAGRYPGDDYGEKAAEIFGRLDEKSSDIPERIRFEVINQQAVTAVYLNDLEAFGFYLPLAVEGVSLLGSRQRQREAIHAYRMAADKWPREPRMRELGQAVRLIAADTAGDDS